MPERVIADLKKYKDYLRRSAAAYFESKPRRLEVLSEIKRAIVPKETPPRVIETLKKHGIKNIKKYNTPEQRTAAREAFQGLMFSVGLPAAAASQIIYGDQEEVSAKSL